MAVKWKTTKDITGEMLATAKALSGTKIEVGVLNGEHAWLAGIHEYGCTIPVTAKMRAYLHSIGVHLNKSTTQIVIPERSFLRAGYDQHKDDIMNLAGRLLPDVLNGTMSEGTFLETVGIQFRDAIKDYAIELSDPPKKPWPTSDSGKGNPLVMSGSMVNGIEYEVKK